LNEKALKSLEFFRSSGTGTLHYVTSHPGQLSLAILPWYLWWLRPPLGKNPASSA